MVAQVLDLELAPQSAQGYDATDHTGLRYQIKSRRLTAHNQSRVLGVIRKLKSVEFDFLVAVLFNEDLTLLEMWKIPYAVVAAHGKWVPTLNGHRISVQGAVLSDDRVERIR